MKNHERIRELLPLFASDELSPEDEQLVAKHLATCAECRAELGEYRRFSAFLNRLPEPQVSDDLLRQARRELHEKLVRESERWSLGRLFDFVGDWMPRPALAVPIGAVALFAAGLVVGAWLLRPGSAESPEGIVKVSTGRGTFQRGGMRTENIRLRNLGEGQVEMSFDAVTPMTVRGDVNGEQVQRIMARALTSEDNPGVRVRAVSALAEDAERIASPDPEIKAALVDALKHDDNPAVRKDALRVLSGLPFDAEVKNAMLYALLHDTNAGVRVAAINALELTKDDARLRDNDILNVLRRKVNDDNNYVRLHARTALQEVSQ